MPFECTENRLHRLQIDVHKRSAGFFKPEIQIKLYNSVFDIIVLENCNFFFSKKKKEIHRNFWFLKVLYVSLENFKEKLNIEDRVFYSPAICGFFLIYMLFMWKNKIWFC